MKTYAFAALSLLAFAPACADQAEPSADEVGQSEDAITNQGTVGSAAIFLRSDWGTLHQGHVGWMYQVSQEGSYHCGAIENSSGQPSVPAGSDIGYWQVYRDWQGCVAEFRARGYDQYRWATINVSRPKDANAEAKRRAGMGYEVFGRNCADATRAVVSSFGISSLPSLTIDPAPASWFAALGGPFEPVTWNGPFSL